MLEADERIRKLEQYASRLVQEWPSAAAGHASCRATVYSVQARRCRRTRGSGDVVTGCRLPARRRPMKSLAVRRIDESEDRAAAGAPRRATRLGAPATGFRAVRFIEGRRGSQDRFLLLAAGCAVAIGCGGDGGQMATPTAPSGVGFTISGIVTDARHEQVVIRRVIIEVRSTDPADTAVHRDETSDDGRYAVALANSGTYVVSVFAGGYESQSRELTIGENVTQDFTLERIDPAFRSATGNISGSFDYSGTNLFRDIADAGRETPAGATTTTVSMSGCPTGGQARSMWTPAWETSRPRETTRRAWARRWAALLPFSDRK